MNSIVLSLVGPHAHESLYDIFERKVEDVLAVGHTFWLYRSFRCTKDLYDQFKPTEAWFIKGSTKNSAKQTKLSDKASEYFEDGIWKVFDEKLSPVTGRIAKNCTAFKIKKFEFIEQQLDFNHYCDLLTNKPVKFSQFCSTTIARPFHYKEAKEQRLRTICCKASLESIVNLR